MKNTSSSVQCLYDRFQTLSITYKTYEHQPLFTCEEASVAYSKYPSFGMCKNLFLKDKKKRYWLLIALVDTQVRFKELAKQLEAPELRFANPDELKQYLGVTPGSVTPFGLINDTHHMVHVIVDEALMQQPTVGFHPLSNDATTLISSTDLKKFIESCGNSMRII